MQRRRIKGNNIEYQKLISESNNQERIKYLKDENILSNAK